MRKYVSNRAFTLSATVMLVLTLGGAGCAKTPTSSEMDFTYKAKENATFEEFWAKDQPAAVVQMTSADQFSPKTVTVSAGRSIMWQNSDTEKHTVTADDVKWLQKTAGVNSNGDGGLGSGSIDPKSSWRWQIPKDTKSGAKIYYHCSIHGAKGDTKSFGEGMVGLIIVK